MAVKRTKGGKFAAGSSGNPSGRPPGSPQFYRDLALSFAEHRAGDLLDLLWGHAHNNPNVAMWLAESIFGRVWLSGSVLADIGSLETAEEIAEARKRATVAYEMGDISRAQFDRLSDLIARATGGLSALVDSTDANMGANMGQPCPADPVSLPGQSGT